MVFFGLLAASGVGLSQPALVLFFGDMIDSFVDGGKWGVTFKLDHLYLFYRQMLYPKLAWPQNLTPF